MSVYASRELYVGTGIVPGRKNRAMIGWHSVLGPGDITVSPPAMESDIDTSIMWSPDDYSYWRSAGTFSASAFSCYVNLLNSDQQLIDYVTLTGHNFANNETGAGYSFGLEYSADGVTWVELVAPKIALDGSTILLAFEPRAVMFCRLKITSTAWTAAAGRLPATFAIAHIRMGRLLRLQRPMFIGMVPFTLNTDARLEGAASVSGKYLGTRLISVHEKYTIQQQFNDGEFVRLHVKPFLNHCRLIGGGGRGPKGSFVCAWRPDDNPDEVLYCHPPASIRAPEIQLGSGMMQFSLSGVASR